MADAIDPAAEQAAKEAADKAAADEAAADAAAKEAAANKAKADKKADKAGSDGKYVLAIWVQSGHDGLAVGQAFKVPGDIAEGLRAAGRARLATAEEAKVLDGDDIPTFESI